MKYLCALKGRWAKYSGAPRPCFNMESKSLKQCKEDHKDSDFVCVPATCKNVQRHWNFNKKYASYGQGYMDNMFMDAKKLCSKVKRGRPSENDNPTENYKEQVWKRDSRGKLNRYIFERKGGIPDKKEGKLTIIKCKHI
jgi:hypothetical protein